VSFRDFLRVAYRHKLLIVLLTLLAGIGSYLLSARQPARYEATSLVLLSSANVPSIVTNTPNPNTGIQPERVAATQAKLARVPVVARRALGLARLRDRTPEQLLGASQVSSDPVSDLLSFSVQDGEPRIAERLATAYGRAYVGYRRMVDAAPFISASRQLERRLEQLKDAGQGRSNLYESLAGQRQQLQSIVALQTSNAKLVRPADEAAKVQPKPARAVTIGLPAGLLLGLAVALLAHVLDTRVRTLGGAAGVLGFPTLGWLPSAPRRYRHQLVMLADPTSAYGEAFTSLRTEVDLARRVHGGEVLMMTTVARRTPGVKSSAVANLAVAFARAGLNVVLVDLDLRQPSLARLFGLTPRNGVTEVVLGRVDVHEALQPVLIHEPVNGDRRRKALSRVEFGGTLRVLPVASRPANPTDVLATRGVGAILEQLRSLSDLVLVDAPPVLEGSDASALSTHVDAMLVIVDVGRDRRGQLAEARRRLAATSATVLGLIGTAKEDGAAAYPPGRLESETGVEVLR
jgi:polysaccharide biosynthesis transport protein